MVRSLQVMRLTRSAFEAHLDLSESWAASPSSCPSLNCTLYLPTPILGAGFWTLPTQVDSALNWDGAVLSHLTSRSKTAYVDMPKPIGCKLLMPRQANQTSNSVLLSQSDLRASTAYNLGK